MIGQQSGNKYLDFISKTILVLGAFVSIYSITKGTKVFWVMLYAYCSLLSFGYLLYNQQLRTSMVNLVLAILFGSFVYSAISNGVYEKVSADGSFYVYTSIIVGCSWSYAVIAFRKLIRGVR